MVFVKKEKTPPKHLYKQTGSCEPYANQPGSQVTRAWLGDPNRSTRRIIQSHSPPVFLGQVQSLILREADLIQPSRRSGDDHHSTHQPDEFTRLAMMSFLTFCGNFLGIFRKCCIPNFFGEDFEPLLILL